jgi:hypothetical protein
MNLNSENSLQNKDTQANLPHKWLWLMDFVQKNPLLTAWNAILLAGGAVLLTYHLGIKYIPDFSLTDLVGFFASVTFTGLAFILGIISACLAPAYFLTLVDKKKELQGIKNSEKEISAIQHEQVNQGVSATNQQPSKTIRTFDGKFDMTVLMFFPLLALLILIGPQLIADDFIENHSGILMIASLCVIILLSVIICLDRKLVSWPTRPIKQYIWWSEGKETFFRRFGGLTLWIFFFFFPFYATTTFVSTGEKERELTAMALGMLLLSTANLLAYKAELKELWKSFAIGGIAVGIIIPMISGHFLLWPEVIVRSLALGSRNAANVTISYKECQALALFKVPCKAYIDKDAQISLQNVNILSRIGTSVLFEVMAESYNDAERKGISSDVEKSTDAAKQEAQPQLEKLKVPSSYYDRLCQNPGRIVDQEKTCGRCDSLLIQHIKDIAINAKDDKAPNQAQRYLDYKSNLVCVQISIPKDQISSMTIMENRQYLGHTSYLLPSSPSVGGH